MEPVDLLIAGGTVITQSEGREIITAGAVAVRGDSILAVGPADNLQGRYSARRVLDATGRLVFPGLINTHTHLFQTFQKGLGEGLTLYEWVRAVTGPSIPLMSERDAYLAAALGGLEALHSGTTTVFDYQYPLPNKELYRSVARAFRDLGLRGSLALGMTETGEQFGLPAYLHQPVERSLAEWDNLTAEIGSEVGHNVLSFGLAPAIVFGITRAGLEKLRAYATERGMLLSLHVNETADDNRAVLAEHGQRAVPFLEELGFWGPDVLAVHCVRLQPEDVEILVRHDVKISHNPISNMYLGSGAAPIVELRRAGLTVGLGTDGAASNNSQDMIETCKCAGLVQKMANQDPSAITAADVLDMATIDGARAIGQGDRLGSLETGKQADLFIYDPRWSRSVPVLDPVASLVFSAGTEGVVTTIVAGQVLLEGGQITTVDEAALLQECQQAAVALAKRAGTLPGHVLSGQVLNVDGGITAREAGPKPE
jgi:5-methylthioadenosine/S-adenosylhomocysteine deaminase